MNCSKTAKGSRFHCGGSNELHFPSSSKGGRQSGGDSCIRIISFMSCCNGLCTLKSKNLMNIRFDCINCWWWKNRLDSGGEDVKVSQRVAKNVCDKLLTERRKTESCSPSI